MVYNIRKKRGGFVEFSKFLEKIINDFFDYYNKKSGNIHMNQCKEYIESYFVEFYNIFCNSNVDRIFKFSSYELKLLRKKFKIADELSDDEDSYIRNHYLIDNLRISIFNNLNANIDKFLLNYSGEGSITMLRSYLSPKAFSILKEKNILFLDDLLQYTKKELMDIFDVNFSYVPKIVAAVHKLGDEYRFADEKFGLNDVSDVPITTEHTLNYLNFDKILFNILTSYEFNVNGCKKRLVTVGDLISLTTEDIREIHGIGDGYFRVILDKVHSLGFKFADERRDESDLMISFAALQNALKLKKIG